MSALGVDQRAVGGGDVLRAEVAPVHVLIRARVSAFTPGETTQRLRSLDHLVPAMTQRHLIVIEGNEATNFSAYSPDLPGSSRSEPPEPDGRRGGQFKGSR